MNLLKKVVHNELGKLVEGQEWFEDPSIFKVNTPAFEEELAGEKAALEKAALNDAEDTAKKSRPTEKGDSLSVYLKPFASDVGALCEKVHSHMQCSGLARYKRRMQQTAKEKSIELKKVQKDLSNRIRNTERKVRDLKDRNIYSQWWHLFLIAVVIFFIGVDAMYNAGSLQVIGLSSMKAWFLSIVVVTGIAVSGYIIIEELKKDGTEEKSWFKIIGLGLFNSALFIGLAVFRSHYLTTFGEQNISFVFSIPVFFVINTIIFGVTSWIIHTHFPTSEQRRIHRKLILAELELLQLRNDLEKAVSDEDELLTEVSNRIQRADDLMDYCDDLIKDLLSFYESIADKWVKEIRLQLPYTPDCLSQPIPTVNYRLVNRKDEPSSEPAPSVNHNSITHNNTNYA